MRTLPRLVSLFAFSTLFLHPQATAHEHHYVNGDREEKVIYNNWVNKDAKGCCNGIDCKPIAEADEKMVNGVSYVYVRGVGDARGKADWCPVLFHHYLSKGNAANSTMSHACITDHYGGATPCGQFICYQPKPLF